MTLLAQKGGENMSNKIYNGTVKQVKRGTDRNKGKRRVLLSINGIGAAYIMWDKTPKGVSFPVGTKIQVRMSKHADDRWIVTEIISIDGKAPAPQQSNNQRNQIKNKNKPKIA